MNNIKVLDCTLRDGGYVNQWQFGSKNIKKIIAKLTEANVDIIECGFLTEKKDRNDDSSLFDTVAKVKEYLPDEKRHSLFVCMINYGEYNIDNLPENDGTSIDGIRVAFHKQDMEKALLFGKKVAEKGYMLFIQPMVCVCYSDQEFIALINNVNNIKPYAFYIVDSFGVMKRKDLMRLFYIVDHNLDNDIFVGYHSHNNIQMAYSNSQALVDLKTKRELIIDSSVFGMGRGAGNLNTELFIEYLNEVNRKKYNSKPLLQIIDQILSSVYLNNYWGYSLPHYASAMHNCHPSYASYLDDKNTLTIENINEILRNIDNAKKNVFDKNYIENLYIQYQARVIADEKSRTLLKKEFEGKTVVLIAPGSSIKSEEIKVRQALSLSDVISVAINFKPDNYICDYIFVSNLRRYEALKNEMGMKLIRTSNIQSDSNEGMVVNYSDLVNGIEAVEDNAGMMLIKLLVDLEVRKIRLAGMDGYSHDLYDNFVEKDMAFIKSDSVMDAMNSGMEKMLKEFSANADIDFITTPRYVNTKIN